MRLFVFLASNAIASSLLTLYFLFSAAIFAHATVDPRNSANNIFGIHIIDENDLDGASNLVNSEGGSWGYVTVVIQDTDRNLVKWQRIFDRMRELKLIPLVRLATHPMGATWVEPKEEDIEEWVKFLSKLTWVVQNRYVILFNEPNHAKEWGGKIDPAGYAKIANAFQKKLKESSSDFFILPAGFDVSAPNSPGTMDAINFFSQMATTEPGIFTIFDGWTSHSYPNPGFLGTPTDVGRGTIRSFEWEVLFLRKYGLSPNAAIFITETGWVHKEGLPAQAGKTDQVLGYDSETVGNFFKEAYGSAWADARIVAVTPFILNYPDRPFDNFSWKKSNSDEYYEQYETVQSIAKTGGAPQQIHDSKFEVLSSLPDKLVADSNYSFFVEFENTGQSIWDPESGFVLDAFESFGKNGITVSEIPKAKPFEKAKIEIKIKTPAETSKGTIVLQMAQNGDVFGERFEKEIEIVAPPSLFVQAQLWFKRKTEGDDFKILLYDDGKVKREITDIKIRDGQSGKIELHDVVPNRTYRFVLIKPFYLPRQKIERLLEDQTVVSFDRLLPFDFNKDGQFTVRDIGNGIINPIKSFQLLVP